MFDISTVAVIFTGRKISVFRSRREDMSQIQKRNRPIDLKEVDGGGGGGQDQRLKEEREVKAGV